MIETIDDDPLNETMAEVNPLDPPCTGTCQWDRGCDELATHNVCQYDTITGETLIEGTVNANFCLPHARALIARIGEYEV
jgi:hypothetical protein